MKALWLLLGLMAGCANTSVEVMAGHKLREAGFVGSGPTATLRLRQGVTDRTFCEYQHVSFLLEGGHNEDSLDQVGCGFRWRGGE